MCMVTPIDRRSLTRITLLMTSRPRSSNTNTFQMGLPSASRMGATGASRPFASASSASADSTVSLRLRIFLREARILLTWKQERYKFHSKPIWRSRREFPLVAMVADDVGEVGAQSGDDSGMRSSGAVLTRAKILATLKSKGCAKKQ